MKCKNTQHVGRQPHTHSQNKKTTKEKTKKTKQKRRKQTNKQKIHYIHKEVLRKKERAAR